MRRRFRENKTRIREILEERRKQYPERKTVAIGLYGGINTSISYHTIMEQYDAVAASVAASASASASVL
jgi:acyl-CoA synthetase (AMP-forming)/AMP-acid ligase II